jgi:hypothetical protein
MIRPKVLDAVPTSLQPKIKAALHLIMNAEHKEAADLAIDQFEATYGAKCPISSSEPSPTCGGSVGT